MSEEAARKDNPLCASGHCGGQAIRSSDRRQPLERSCCAAGRLPRWPPPSSSTVTQSGTHNSYTAGQCDEALRVAAPAHARRLAHVASRRRLVLSSSLLIYIVRIP